ncbi:MAG: glutaredoxin domain-containing protein [Bacteroidota bacterium]
MTITEVNSYEDLMEKLKGQKKAFLLLFKEGTENSECALKSIKNTKLPENTETAVLAANVGNVRDIHTRFGIKSAPTLMRFENGEFKSEVKGCHDPGYYGSLITNELYTASGNQEGKKQNRVTVYSTPSCPHCNTLKSHLRHHGIVFRDVNVAADQAKAQELVKRTGQQGVPQAEINGQWVLGFDKSKVNRLLGIVG